jgi:membrane-bound ClpP family serine protease
LRSGNLESGISDTLPSPTTYKQQLSYMLLAATIVAIVIGLLLVALTTALSLRKRFANRDVQLIGKSARVETMLTPDGTVIIGGELWPARSVDGVITSQRRVRVVGVNGLVLLVEACD